MSKSGTVAKSDLKPSLRAGTKLIIHMHGRAYDGDFGTNLCRTLNFVDRADLGAHASKHTTVWHETKKEND